MVVYDNFTTGRKEFLAPQVEVVRGDVLDLKEITNAMKGCDFVFHFQANADVRGGKQHTRVDLEQNTIATWNVLDAMRINSVKGIAFASSAAVYGEPTVFPTPENYAPVQTSLYGASKLAGEAMIEAYCEYFAMRSFSFRGGRGSSWTTCSSSKCVMPRNGCSPVSSSYSTTPSE